MTAAERLRELLLDKAGALEITVPVELLEELYDGAEEWQMHECDECGDVHCADMLCSCEDCKCACCKAHE